MKLHVFLNSYGIRREVGMLSDENGRILFEYAPEFLSSGIELSPFKLPLRPGVFEDEKRTFDGLFGLFNDSLPDGWGCLLLDRKFRKWRTIRARRLHGKRTKPRGKVNTNHTRGARKLHPPSPGLRRDKQARRSSGEDVKKSLWLLSEERLTPREVKPCGFVFFCPFGQKNWWPGPVRPGILIHGQNPL